MASVNVSVAIAQNNSLPVVFYPTWAAISMVTVGTVGVFGNAFILLAIASEKLLRSRCHALMALLALSDVVTCIYLIQIRVYILLGDLHPTNLHCFNVSIYGLLAQNLQTALGLTIGIDRFLAVFAPARYLKWRAATYLVIMLTPSLLFSFALIAYGYTQTDIAKIVGYCTPVTAFNGPSQTAWLASNAVIIVLVIVTYTTTAVQLHISSNSSSAATRRIIGSLQVIVGVYCVTWALTIFSIILLRIITFPPDTANFILMFAGWPAVFNSSSNFFIYTWRSTDFRIAFSKIFRIQSNRVVTISAGGATSVNRAAQSTKNTIRSQLGQM